MARPNRRVQTNGADNFVLSEQNPNDTCGGHCACGKHPTDQHGPFIVFKGEGPVQLGHQVKLVVCAPCAKSAVVKIENDDELLRVGAGGPRDNEFDGGEPTAPADFQAHKARYEGVMAGRPLLETPTLAEWLKAEGLSEVQGDATGGLATTGIDPNAKSLLQARADTSPVGTRGDRTPVGRIDDPVEQLKDPANWGVPEGQK